MLGLEGMPEEVTLEAGAPEEPMLAAQLLAHPNHSTIAFGHGDELPAAFQFTNLRPSDIASDTAASLALLAMVSEAYGLEFERTLRNVKLGQQLHRKKRKIIFTVTDEAKNCAVFVQRDMDCFNAASPCHHLDIVTPSMTELGMRPTIENGAWEPAASSAAGFDSCLHDCPPHVVKRRVADDFKVKRERRKHQGDRLNEMMGSEAELIHNDDGLFYQHHIVPAPNRRTRPLFMLLDIMLALHVNNAPRQSLKDAVLPALNQVVAIVDQVDREHAALGHKPKAQLSANLLPLTVEMNRLTEVAAPSCPRPALVARGQRSALPDRRRRQPLHAPPVIGYEEGYFMCYFNSMASLDFPGLARLVSLRSKTPVPRCTSLNSQEPGVHFYDIAGSKAIAIYGLPSPRRRNREELAAIIREAAGNLTLTQLAPHSRLLMLHEAEKEKPALKRKAEADARQLAAPKLPKHITFPDDGKPSEDDVNAMRDQREHGEAWGRVAAAKCAHIETQFRETYGYDCPPRKAKQAAASSNNDTSAPAAALATRRQQKKVKAARAALDREEERRKQRPN